MADEEKRSPIRLILDAAEDFVDPDPDPAGDDQPPRRRRVAPGKLPDDCPVIPLGVKGKVCYYLDEQGQLAALVPNDHSKRGIEMLFGAQAMLVDEYWPRFTYDKKSDEWIQTGWKAEDASRALMIACHQRGPFDPVESMRGVGAWRGDAGELVIHMGDQVLVTAPGGGVGAGWEIPPAGEIGAYIYPSAPKTARPFLGDVAPPIGARGPAAELLVLLERWHWRRPDLDPVLLLGWIAGAFIGGAMDWRPTVWLTGGAGVGKSTLHDLLRGIFDKSLVSVSDTTAAGLWQKLGYSSLPVAIDELEADEDGRRAGAIVKLMRESASGGKILRGGGEHTGAEFYARSAFLASSILVPPMEGKDQGRQAVLEMDPIPDETPPIDLDLAGLPQLGAMLRRRMIEEWPRFKETRAAYNAALHRVGHDARGADQFGTLLTCYDLAMFDHTPDSDSADELAGGLQAAYLAEWLDNERDEIRFINRLLSTTIDAYRTGKRRSVGQWIEEAAAAIDGAFQGIPNSDPAEANDVLALYGLKVWSIHLGAGQRPQKILAIANSHQGLAELMEKSHWRAKSGTAGVWRQAARRLPGAQAGTKSIRIGGAVCRVTNVPLDGILEVSKAVAREKEEVEI